MRPNEVKLSTEEKIMVATTGVVKGLYKSMTFWFIVWEFAVGYFWFPRMDAMFSSKPQPSDFYLNIVLAGMAAFGTLIVTSIILIIIASVFEGMHDHFKKHIENETETYKKTLLDKVDDHLLRK